MNWNQGEQKEHGRIDQDLNQYEWQVRSACFVEVKPTKFADELDMDVGALCMGNQRSEV